MATVAIFGGGIGGLSAAHQLIRRGFGVTVYEGGDVLGGKAATQPLLGTGVSPRLDLPGEHGFRFYPGFYRHLIETMFEIPGVDAGTFVDEDLRESNETAIVFAGRPPIKVPRRLPHTVTDVVEMLMGVHVDSTITTPADLELMVWHRLKYLTSGPARRENEYDTMSWSDFLELDTLAGYTTDYKKFERAVPRTLSAMVADKCSAYVIGDITMQMLLGYIRPDERPDAALGGPTTARWLQPWIDDLTARGVVFHLDRPLTEVVLNGSDPSRVDHAVVQGPSGSISVTADYYVVALPLEAMQPVIAASSGLADQDDAIANLLDPALDPTLATDWMVGAQFFLTTDVPICQGHVMYADSPWALTSVSPNQFWAAGGHPIDAEYGDGTVKGLLSVAISDWDVVSSRIGKTAKTAGSLNLADPRGVILDEVFAQLQDALGTSVLPSALVAHRQLDQHITFDGSGNAQNPTPLLIHPKNTWKLRPNASLDNISNLFLASDYVKTYTKLATMEGANEAARRAVNAILRAESSALPECTLWPLHEEVLGEARQLDDHRYALGEPHLMDEIPGDAVDALLALETSIIGNPFALLP